MFQIVEGMLKIVSGKSTEGRANVTPDFELVVHDAKSKGVADAIKDRIGDVSTAGTELYLLSQINKSLRPVSSKTAFDSGFISKAAPAAYNWALISGPLSIPTGMSFVPIFFSFTCSATAYSGRLAERITFGSYNQSAVTKYTDGSAGSDAMDFFTDVELEVTTAWVGGAGTVTLTVTYIDEQGKSQVVDVAFTRGNAVGTRTRMTIAGTSAGVVDITNVALKAGSNQTAGAVTIYGFKEIAACSTKAAGDTGSSAISGVVVRSDRDLVTEMTASATTSATARTNVVGYLIQEG